jgi:cystathionine beta-lyase
LLTLELQPWIELAQAEKFIDALRLFRLGYSWGGPVSLVMIYDPDSARELSKPYAGPLIRFAAGLEEIQDLRADIDQALLRAGLI